MFKRNNRKDDNPHKHKRKPLEISNDPLDYITNTLKKRDEKKHSKREHKLSSTPDKKKKKHSHSSSHSRSKESPSSSIEELRAKRLERERNEQSRLKSLYLHDDEAEDEKVELDDRKRGYNSQFNRDETSKAQDHRKKKLRFQ